MADLDTLQAFPEHEEFESSVAAGWRSLPRERVLRSPEIYQRRMQELGDFNRGFKIRDLWEEMELNGVQPTETMCLLALYHAMKGRRLNDAAYYFDQLRDGGHQPTLRAYIYMISACGRCGQLDLAYKYLSEMRAAGLPANSDIYMAVMNGLGERGSWKEAEALFQEMQGLHMPIHEIIHSALLAAYGRAESVPVGTDEHILQLLENSRSANTHSFSRGRPDGLGILSVNPAIRSLQALGYHEATMELFESLHAEQLQPDLNTFSSVISSLAKDAAGHFRQPDTNAKTLVVTRLKGILARVKRLRQKTHRAERDSVSIADILRDDADLAASVGPACADQAMLQRHDTAGFPHLQNHVVPLQLLQQSMAAWPTLPAHHVHSITPALAAQLAIHAATACPESFSHAVALWRSVMARGLTIAIASACELIQCAVHMHSIGMAGAEEIGCDIVQSTASGGQYLNIVQGSYLLSLASRPQSWSLAIADAVWDAAMKDAKTPTSMSCQDYYNLLQRKVPQESQRIQTVRNVMLLEEQKETSRKDQRGSQPQRTATQILRLRNEPPPQREPAWKLMERRAAGRARQQHTDWIPASARQQQRGRSGSLLPSCSAFCPPSAQHVPVPDTGWREQHSARPAKQMNSWSIVEHNNCPERHLKEPVAVIVSWHWAFL
ncbi:hypothetical protein WJX74_007185 [Apatococcus lobatus]|uniref:Pentatricopeptide repeat-containing protein n=1 Tax=Apatococcus lobatus TaxID=904363 RepID=A0AAW1PXQ2_9CHLO